jgi:hypothetical protein
MRDPPRDNSVHGPDSRSTQLPMSGRRHHYCPMDSRWPSKVPTRHGVILQLLVFVDPLQGRGRRGGLDIGHEDFVASHPRRSASRVPMLLQSPGSGQPTPRRHAARTALPTKRAPFTTCVRDRSRCACWLAIGSPDPSQPTASTELTRSARTCRCLLTSTRGRLARRRVRRSVPARRSRCSATWTPISTWR